MGRLIVMGCVLGVLSFALALGVPLAMTGNLSAPKIMAALKGEPALAESEAAVAPDELGDLAARLKKREAALNERERELRQLEAQVKRREEDLEQTRKRLEDLQTQLEGGLEEAAEERTMRIKTVALSISNMKADKAAEALSGMPPDEVAEILLEVRDRDRGKILDAMSPDRATRVLSALQEVDVPGA